MCYQCGIHYYAVLVIFIGKTNLSAHLRDQYWIHVLQDKKPHDFNIADGVWLFLLSNTFFILTKLIF